MTKKISVIAWNENVHEQEMQVVRDIYPQGIHGCLAGLLNEEKDILAETATLQEPEHGLSQSRLDNCDVLLWWGHAAHAQVSDEVVARVYERVLQGMGLIVLHSGHFSKIFRRMMGTSCALQWREADEKEVIWTVNPGHPIAKGIPAHFILENEEMYGEPFVVPEANETVFMGWFAGGNVFRSGLVYNRGAGRIFYFQPGHETHPTYHQPVIRKVLVNAVRYVAPRHSSAAWKNVEDAPNGAPIIPIPGYVHKTEQGLR
ncbi:ThuA domain-containing protein [Candidatus Haliotispira prima]|uniref:ThuA domain-containing protein n=1 Tax=Candidatus Haliotispira prima TaxID=3034016 RepID=A0ABY8MJ10_9SPIO|nr:ThuA domain-containing protein [Candidatus Haliotispira prima]